MAVPSVACPSEEEILLYLGGVMPEVAAAAVREHIGTCAACRDLVVAEAKGPDTVPAPTRPILAGKYVIERELGSGGMGKVMLARHLKLGRLVAIKTIHAAALDDPSVIERFHREARAAAGLRSRHVVQVLDIDVGETGEPFIVMEMLDGIDLATKVARDGAFSVDAAVNAVLEACEGLAEAHDAGIVHRDLKPQNLFLARMPGDEPPIVKVLDFGLAKMLRGPAAGVEEPALTGKSDLLGTPRFMSPEHFSGTVDHRSDIWSMGVTLYFLLTKASPFTARSLSGLQSQITKGERVSLRSRRPSIPAFVDAAIERCLALRPEDRWSSIDDFAEALRAGLDLTSTTTATASPAPRTGSTGRTLPFDLGRYSVLRRIAAGGMATVYLGEARGAHGFSRSVAIKQLHPHLSQDASTRRRFLDEARLVSRIDHPHVVKMLDVVEDADEVFLVMDYVDGQTLAALLRASREQDGSIPLPVVSSIFCDVADALHAAHEAMSADGTPLGIVHRDVSPHNVLVSSRGAAYVTDFGIAKVKATLGETQSEVMGKAGYMAPEQLRGEAVTRAADVFALGVMLWEALTKTRLFEHLEDRIGREVSGTARAVEPPTALVPGAPRELDDLVMWALARDPAARPATALAFSEALARLVAPAPADAVAAWTRGVATDKVVVVQPAAAPRRRGAVRTLAVAGAIVVAAGLGVLLLRAPAPRDEAPSPLVVPSFTTSGASLQPPPTAVTVTSSPAAAPAASAAPAVAARRAASRPAATIPKEETSPAIAPRPPGDTSPAAFPTTRK